MNKQITHKQHYIWRKYLEPWGIKEGKKLFVWWNNHKIIKYTDVYDILREKDFYAFAPLNKLEFFCLKNIFAKTNNKTIRELNTYIDNFINLIQRIDNLLTDKNDFNSYLIQAGESFQSSIEKNGAVYLDLLKSEALNEFNYNEDGLMIEFLIFLLFQYLRTKKSKDLAVNSVKNNDQKLKKIYKKEMNDKNDYEINWSKVYNFGFIYVVTTAAYNMAKKHAHIKLLKTKKRKIYCF